MPAVTPETIPLDEPIVAIPVLPLLQLPPEVTQLTVVVEPTQTFNVPVIGAIVGKGFTVTGVVTKQPVLGIV